MNASGNVLAGATLAGSGTVGTTLVHGTLSLGSDGGNALGTLSLAAVGFTPGSIFRVGIDGAGQSDRLVITGNGSVLDGTVQVDARAGTYAPNQQYTILQVQNGGTYSNRFAGVTSNYAFLSPVLSYNAAETEVYLTLTMGGTVGFSRVAFTPNQFAVATATERLGFGQQVFDAVAVLTAEDARTAFDALSGEMNASATGVANGDVQAVQGAVLNRLRSGPVASPQALAALSSAVAAYSADLSTRRGVVATPVSAPAAPVSLWGQAIGSRGELEGDSNAASLDRRTGGLVIGADMGFEGRWRAGFAGAWSRSKADLGARLSSAEIDTYSGTLYGATQFGALALRGGLTYAHHEVDTTRTILFPGYSGATSSNRSGHSWQAFSEVGYGLQLASFAVEPFAGLAHVSTDLGGYQEVGNTAASNAAALAGHGSDLSLTYASLGVRVAMPFGALTARAGLSWRHAFGDVVPTTTQAFAANPAVPFTVSGTPVARDTLAVETGLDWAMSRNVALGVSYDGQFANRAQEHALKGDLKVRF